MAPVRRANRQCLAFRGGECFSPGSRPTDPWPAIAAAILPCGRDDPITSRRPPAPPKSKWSAKPAACTDTLRALREFPVSPACLPSLGLPPFSVAANRKTLRRRRRLQFAQPRNLLRQGLKLLQDFLMPNIFGGRFSGGKTQRSTGFQNALLNFRKRIEALLASGGGQLFLGNQFLLEFVFVNFSVFDQNVRAAFDDLIQLAMVVQKSHDQVIDGE